MAGKPLRVALIGCGTQGQNHLVAFRTLPDIEIVAVCDLDETRLNAVADQFGVANRYRRYEELIAGGHYDLVSICTMPVSHREMVVAALEAGAHVLCEKPMAMSADEGAAMVETARRVGRVLTFGFNMRFMPNAQLLKRFVERGRLGTLHYLRAWTFATDIPWWGKHYIKRISGGGVLASTAVHTLDLALWVAGNPRPLSATATMGRTFPRKRGQTAPCPEAAADYDVEDVFGGHLRFVDGSWMTLEGAWSWDRPAYSYSFELAGEAATVEFAPVRVTAERDGEPVNLPLEELGPGADPDTRTGMEGWQESIEAEIADVVDALRTGRQPLVRAEEALVVQAIVDALYQSAELGREVAITLPAVLDHAGSQSS